MTMRVVVCTMKTEELTQESAADSLHFDAHEFDGLRKTLEHEAETIFSKVDECVRDHPWLCMALAVTAGLALVCAVRRE